MISVEERKDGRVYVDVPKGDRWHEGEPVPMAKRDPRNKQGDTIRYLPVALLEVLM